MVNTEIIILWNNSEAVFWLRGFVVFTNHTVQHGGVEGVVGDWMEFLDLNRI